MEGVPERPRDAEPVDRRRAKRYQRLEAGRRVGPGGWLVDNNETAPPKPDATDLGLDRMRMILAE